MNTAKGIKPSIHARVCSLFAAIALTSAASLPAQELLERETYEKRMTSAKTVEALGSELFGDSISLQTGALSFSAVDIDLPGNNALPVRFGRSYTVVNSRDESANHAMRDWRVQLPSISARFGTEWLGDGNSPNRCSVPGSPALPPDLAPHFMTNSYYQGMQLDIPGVGGGELLRIEPGMAQPLGGAVMTVDGQIQVQCSVNALNTTGQGFLVLMPDGTRYRFDWMATRAVAPLLAPRNDTSSPNPGSVVLPINERSMYPTRVEDRFGNFVEYTYANAANEPVRVTRIRSSDNRQIDVGYDASNSRVVSASANGRTWSYHYENDASPNGRLILRRVTLPDAKTWEINFQSLSYSPIVADTRQGALEEQTCFNQALPRNLSDNIWPSQLIGSITHPSGATGTFRVGLLEHGKSNVTLSCDRVTTTPPTAQPGTGNITSDDVNLFAISSYSWTLLDKEISGTGVPLQRWQYQYDSDISAIPISPGSYNFPVCMGAQCYVPTCTSDSCAGTARTLITRPDGSKERYVFGNSWQYNEGKLLRIERLDVTPPNTPEIVLESTTDTYLLNHGTQAFPRYFGRSMRVNQDGFDAENHRPKIATTITRDGVNFTWSVASCGNLCMDALARPTQVTKRSSNSQGGSVLHTKTEAYEYEDNNALWVLGQLRRTQVNGIESARADYYPGTALLQNVYIFGMLKQRLEYNADGTMSAIFDGKNQRTGLSNWYRGVPRTVTYHDQTSESATVDANGWITSTTDPRQRTTGFGYDAMGDLTSITPPFNPDGPAWAATSILFERMTSPQFGLSGYWRQRTTRGNYRQDAYYDELYRPVLVHETTTNGSGVNRFVVKSFDLMNREQFTAFPRETLGTVAEATTGVRRTFDAIGRIRTEIQDSELGALTTQIDYLAGFRKRITNPRGKQTEYDYQAFDQPSDELPMQIIAPAGQTTVFTRDVFGKATRIARTAVIDNVSTTVDRRYVYDSSQRLCKRIEPETGAHIVDYDAADNVLWSAHGLTLTDASPGACNRENVPLSEQIARSYDGRNRLLLINYPDATADTGYSYFADGALQTATRSGSTWSYEYNTLGLLRTETLSYAGQVRSFSYAYNSSGHLTSTTYPATTLYPTGEVVPYSPNGLGEPTQVGGYAGGIAHHAVGAVRQATLGNGTAFNRELNVRRLPTRLSYVRGGDTQVDLSFGFDANSNVVAINDLRPGGTDSQSFGYDDLDRLTQATAPGSYQSAVFEYDAFDNLRRHQLGTRDHRYRYTDGTNRLTAIQTAAGASVQSFLYDARGNATSTATAGSATISTEYDRADTLTRLTGPQNEQYRYDAHGHRIEVTTGGVTRYPVYTKDGLLRAEYGPGETDTYYYLGTQQIARLRNNLRVDLIFRSGFEALGSIMEKLRQYMGLKTFAVTYYLNDHLGSTIATASATGQVVERSLFAPYGERWGLPTTRGLGFTGHFEDATSLTYMKARYYGATVGRFNSPDPVLTETTNGRHFNRYWYADGNPQKFVDPDGKKAGKTVAWLVRLTAKGMQKVERLTMEQAVKARKKEQNIVADRKGQANQIETAAHGKENLIRHKGHELDEEGTTGLPHYQTDKKLGHSFWGKLSAAAGLTAGMLNDAAKVAEAADVEGAISSGSPELVNHERTWFGSYRQINPDGPNFYEAMAMSPQYNPPKDTEE